MDGTTANLSWIISLACWDELEQCFEKTFWRYWEVYYVVHKSTNKVYSCLNLWTLAIEAAFVFRVNQDSSPWRSIVMLVAFLLTTCAWCCQHIPLDPLSRRWKLSHRDLQFGVEKLRFFSEKLKGHEFPISFFGGFPKSWGVNFDVGFTFGHFAPKNLAFLKVKACRQGAAISAIWGAVEAFL